MSDTTINYLPETPDARTITPDAGFANGVILVTRGQGAGVCLLAGGVAKPLPLNPGPDAFRISASAGAIRVEYAMVWWPSTEPTNVTQWFAITPGDANEDAQGYIQAAQALAGGGDLTVQAVRRVQSITRTW